jgi:hypothetical protein
MVHQASHNDGAVHLTLGSHTVCVEPDGNDENEQSHHAPSSGHLQVDQPDQSPAKYKGTLKDRI